MENYNKEYLKFMVKDGQRPFGIHQKRNIEFFDKDKHTELVAGMFMCQRCTDYKIYHYSRCNIVKNNREYVRIYAGDFDLYMSLFDWKHIYDKLGIKFG